MATNVEKAIQQQPLPLDEQIDQTSVDPTDVGQDVEVELPPDDDGSVEITLGDEDTSKEDDVEFDANLAESLSESDMVALTSDLIHEIDNDIASRTDWEKTYREGLKLLGLRMEERTEPWDGACGVFHPMVAEAVVRFQAEVITETFPAQGPVRTKILGKETPDKKQAAVRVETDMNNELTERMTEFRGEHERMLWSLPAVGSAFKKVYEDPTLGRQVSMFVPAEDVVIPYGTADLDSCYRITHIMRKTRDEIVKLQEAGFYRQVDIPEGVPEKEDIKDAKDRETGFNDLNDNRLIIYESHVDLMLPSVDETKVTLPYVVTIIKGENIVLGVRRNWREDDELKLKRLHFVHYQYVPGFGAYGYGLFHLIGGYAKSSTAILRQLVDAGTLANLPGGLKSRGLRIKGDDTPIAPGEWRDVDVASGNIRDSILPLPYKEPSATLAALLDKIVEEGRRFAATADMEVSDMSAQAPVGTTLALIERQLKVLTAVQARVHFALKQELKLLKAIIRDNAPADYDYDPEYGDRSAKQADYDMVEVIPVSDPNAATMSQRVVQYQAVIQMAQMAPDIYDMPQLHRSMLEVLGIKNAEKLVPLPDDMKPTDPISENQALMSAKPVKSFMYQDHDAHIAVHSMILQDPVYAQMLAQNPRATAIQGSIMAHIAEHAGYKMRRTVEGVLGMPLPPEGEPLPPEVEQALSGLMARAAAQVVQMDQAKIAMAQAQQQAQDPVLQLQQQDMANETRKTAIAEADQRRKQAETQAKITKGNADTALKARELEIRRVEAAAKLRQDAANFQEQRVNNAHQRVTQARQQAAQDKQTSVRNKIDTLTALSKGKPPMNKESGNE